MRNILFRGKTTDDNHWIYGYLIKVGNIYAIVDKYAIPVVPETIGQFTGKVTEQGEKIFEGDIIKHCNGRRYKIIWTEYGYAFCADGIDIEDVDHLNKFPHDCIDLIGNIHDNPELL